MMSRLFDLDLLNALVVVAETGSLSAAAPRLCRSQSDRRDRRFR